MVESLKNVIQPCFNSPQLTLGGKSEVNCQTKVVFLTLWELGWDPVNQLFLNFQIAKEQMKKSSPKASAAADIVAATQEGIYLVCEVKYWDSPTLARSIDQVRGYQEALNAHRACLTNGRRWMIFERDNESPLIDKTFSNVGEMLALLKEWISPQAITVPSSYPYPQAFELGIATAKKGQSIKMFNPGKIISTSSLWNPETHSNPIVRQFIEGLHRFSQEEASSVWTDEGTTSISLKDRRSRKKLIEYQPLTNMICNTFYDHGKLGVPADLSREYHLAVKKYGKPLTSPKIIISYLKSMVKGLIK